MDFERSTTTTRPRQLFLEGFFTFQWFILLCFLGTCWLRAVGLENIPQPSLGEGGPGAAGFPRRHRAEGSIPLSMRRKPPRGFLCFVLSRPARGTASFDVHPPSTLLHLSQAAFLQHGGLWLGPGRWGALPLPSPPPSLGPSGKMNYSGPPVSPSSTLGEGLLPSRR